jgi:hypothetical protein
VAHHHQPHLRVALQQQGERGDHLLHPLGRDQPADVEQRGVALPVHGVQLRLQLRVGLLGDVAAARRQRLVQRRAGQVPAQGGQHGVELRGGAAAGEAGERLAELGRLAGALRARDGLELAGVHAQVQVHHLLVQARDAGEDAGHPPAHLGADHEDAPRRRERLRRQAQEALVALDGVLQRAAVRHDGEGDALRGAHALRHHRHEHGVVGVHGRDPVLAHDAAERADVAVRVRLDRRVVQVHHGHDVGELLVLVPHVHGKGVAQHRLVEDAAAGVLPLLAPVKGLDAAVGW